MVCLHLHLQLMRLVTCDRWQDVIMISAGTRIVILSYHGNNVTLQTNTFQAVMVTDGTNSFAIFIYRCGDLQWSGGATIGYGASSEMFSNHRFSGTFFTTSIACLNTPDNQFVTLLYEITNSTEGKNTLC